MKFSVLLSVYLKESSNNLKEALNSMVEQTLIPDEIILVIDGLITTDLTNVIDDFKKQYPSLLATIELEENAGLGNALRIGLQYCKYEIVARMDTDDISLPTRFEKQINFLKEHPSIAIVGTNLEEFKQFPGDLKIYKRMPECGKKLIAYAKYRNPLNHPTIMFRKKTVQASGSYDNNIPLFEDFSLFIRMLKNGYQFYNLQENLVYFRVGNDLAHIKRRSGWHYMKNEIKFLRYAYQINYLNIFELLKSLSFKIFVRLFPSAIVLWFYTKLLRDKQMP